MNKFPLIRIDTQNDRTKILGLFDYLKLIITKFGNEQSGGMAFCNFDNDIAELLRKLSIEENKENYDLISVSLKQFI
jgi:hypothetical protein